MIQISRKNIIIPGLKCKIKIVAVSDLHLPSRFVNPVKFVEMINRENPDIFVLIGDIVDKSGYEDLISFVTEVQVRFHKISILGNWEYQSRIDLQKLKAIYNESGVKLLVNKDISIRGLRIVGLDDFLEGEPNYTLINNVSASAEPLLILSHCPQSFDYIPDENGITKLMLSGHTHGGQIALFGKVFWTPSGSGKYVSGFYRKNNNYLYVMRGIGTTGLPIRIGSRPEILVLELRETESL
jgi:predicted MPP superfamily phosphohydrolase